MNKNIFEQLNIKWILLIGFVVHISMLTNGFTYYSDDVYVLNNLLVHKLNGNTINAIFSTYFDGHYHPLTLLSLAFTYLWSGTNAFGYQATNLAFHLFNCWMIYKILTKLELKKSIVAISALIFAVHPLNVESVARITERKDTQYVLFLLLAVYFFIEFCKDESKRKFYFWTVLCFALSLLSKGQAVVLPLILYVIGWYQLKTNGTKIKHLYIAPLFVLSILFGYLNYRAQLVTGYLSETEVISIKQVIVYPSTIIFSYILKLIAPIGLSAQYPIPAISLLSVLYVLAVLLATFGVYKLWKNKRYLMLTGILLYAASVFPMLRIVPVSENFMPDRYNYLGLLGFGIFIGSLYLYIADKYRKYNVSAVFMVWLFLLSALCFNRTTVWKDGFSIWEDAYKKQPKDAFTSLNYGTYLVNTKRDVNKGIALCKESVKASPGNILARSHYMDVLTSSGMKEEALNELKEIYKAKPVESSNISNRAVILLQHGKASECAAEFDKAVYLQPAFAKNRINRAGFYFNQFQFEKALNELDTLEGLHSNYLEMIYLLRANVYIHQGKPDLAQKSINALRDLGEDKKQLNLLQEKIVTLNLITGNDVSKMNREAKEKYASDLYAKGFYYQAFSIFDGLLKSEGTDEKTLNNIMACAYNLSRPDLMKEYIEMMKTKGYPLNEKSLNYLKGLGI